MKISYDSLEFDFIQNGKVLHFDDNSKTLRSLTFDRFNGLGSKYETICFHDKKLTKKTIIKYKKAQQIKILLSLDILIDVVAAFNQHDKIDWGFTLKLKGEPVVCREYFNSEVPRNYPLYASYAQLVFDYDAIREMMPIKKWN